MKLLSFFVMGCFLILGSIGCVKKTTYEPILISKDVCHYCKMVIVDKRFGAELVTEKGKVYKFDAIECLAHHMEEHPEMKGTTYVVNSFAFPEMIEFKNAFFSHDPNIRSPMGKGLFASDKEETLKSNVAGAKEVLKWQDVLKLIGRPELISSF